MSYLPHTSNSKRSTSCSNSNFTPSKNISKSSTTTNNNNHFHTRYSTSPGSFLIHQTPGHLPYSPSTCRSKGPSYLNNSVNPSPSVKYNMTGRFRTREPVMQRDFPIKSTYRPENINDWSYNSQESHFGSLAKPSRNVEVGDLSLSGLSVSGQLSIKKSTSHQDMSNQLPSPKYHHGIATRNEHARPLPELHSICRRSNPQSTFHTSRRSSFTKGRMFEESRVPQIRDSVADTVARLNRLNEAEKVNPSLRLKSVENSDERNAKDDWKEVGLKDAGDENNGEVSSSSITNSPNNNTNNFSRKYMNKGCTGLQNLGNTCFMNCVLQCLANTRPLLELCLNSDLLKEINNETSRLRGSLATAYVDLMQSMWRGLDVITPGQFKVEVSRFARLFAGYNQQDAQEFLMYLLQGLHEDLNRVREKKKKKLPVRNSIPDDDRISATEKAILSWKRHLELENSYIVDLFEGLLKSALKCRLCGYVSNTFDPFLGLSLPIKKVPGHGDTTLMDCLELFTHEELLDENEKTTCDKCKRKQNSTKRLSIQKFPNILVINLKRFSEETFYRSKLSTFVRCPVRNLDLRKFSDENVGDRAVYNLYGVCNHSGTPHGGHYTAMAKNPYSNEWHYFNDQNVSAISENVNPVSSEAYILFYELSSK